MARVVIIMHSLCHSLKFIPSFPTKRQGVVKATGKWRFMWDTIRGLEQVCTIPRLLQSSLSRRKLPGFPRKRISPKPLLALPLMRKELTCKSQTRSKGPPPLCRDAKLQC